MKFVVTYPLLSHPHDPSFITGAAITRFARVAEQAGFDGVGFTDHPAPTERWLAAGGHDALDPFVALSYVAAATERVRLIPNILVLPYRNPFIVAKSVATLDALSGGRFTVAVATGYLKGEYKALGVNFDERNELFDEAIHVMNGIWSTDDFAYEGKHFTAHGQSANPKPASAPPIWIGGNSKLSRRRVAEYGHGWRPFLAPRALAGSAKTPPLETAEDLAVMLDYLWQHVDEAGRDRAEIDVAFGTIDATPPGSDTFNADAELEGLNDLAQLGVTWAEVSVPGDSIDHAIDALEQYGDGVISH